MALTTACPGRGAARSDATQSRDPTGSDQVPALRRTAKRRCAASGTRRARCAHKRKAPPFGGAFFTHSPIRLAVLVRHLLPLTIGVRLLTAGILLLLARFLATALLLLAGLLTRVLVLLARIVLIGHGEFSVV